MWASKVRTWFLRAALKLPSGCTVQWRVLQSKHWLAGASGLSWRGGQSGGARGTWAFCPLLSWFRALRTSLSPGALPATTFQGWFHVHPLSLEELTWRSEMPCSLGSQTCRPRVSRSFLFRFPAGLPCWLLCVFSPDGIGWLLATRPVFTYAGSTLPLCGWKERWLSLCLLRFSSSSFF